MKVDIDIKLISQVMNDSGVFCADYEWRTISEYEITGVKAYGSEYELPDGTEKAWIVYAIYGDGDTFGYSSGDILIIGVEDSEDIAQAVATKAREIVNYGGRGGSFEVNDKDYDVYELTGYFNQCEGIFVEGFDVLYV